MVSPVSSSDPLSSRRSTPLALWRIALLWGVVVLASFIAIAVYAKIPGRQAPPASQVGEHLPTSVDGAWRIVMAIHPRCPCSKASIANLQQLLQRDEKELAVDLYVYRPAASTREWSDTALVRQSQQLPSLTLHDDIDGSAAREYGIETSGGIVLYSPEGVAVFYGGITPSRGHTGANEGLKAIEDAISGKPVALDSHPVYGCPLFDGGGAS